MKHSLAIAALVATSFGTLATLPAIAQPAKTEIAHRGPTGGGHFMLRGGFGPGFASFFCREGAAEFVEVSLVRLAYRLDLTEDQRPLFNSFRDTALAAQADFAEVCASAALDQNSAPDIVEMLHRQLVITEAQAEALAAILPDFEAFYTSLTPEQVATLGPWGKRRPAPPAADEGATPSEPEAVAPAPPAASDRDAPGREAPGREAPGREAPGRDAPGRDAPGRAPAPGR
jgi:hypothetical protein